MAKIRRKPHTQQRFVDLADSKIGGFTTGYIPYVASQGVEFTIKGKDYDFLVGMSFDEWNDLKDVIERMRNDVPTIFFATPNRES